jgi:hypothetical protein
MGISVRNDTGHTIDVAINQWGDDAQTTFFTIKANETESWSRSDGRGFVMVITNGGEKRENGTYWFVKDGNDLYVQSLNTVAGSLAKLPNPYNS